LKPTIFGNFNTLAFSSV